MESPIPAISVSLAPQEDISGEPFSPFTPNAWPITPDDAYRSQHLTPPPTGSSPRFPRQLSPLRPPDSPIKGSGLERERFEAMLKASQERSVSVGGKRTADLRKEIAMKTHKSKQIERRALFLSKVQAPPSPSAISLPKTPPESPAIFHYTLPSPGLNSPLALFDGAAFGGRNLDYVEPWVEQVDFRLPEEMQSKSISKGAMHALRGKLSMPGKSLPSLDQITARLSSHGHMAPPPRSQRSPMRLPAFLQSHSAEPPRAPIPTDVATVSSTKTRASLPVGRPRGPLKAPPSMLNISAPKPLSPSVDHRIFPPGSPRSPVTPKLQVTTTIVPRSATLSPTELSERNVSVLSRARTAKDMLSTLKRRTHPSDQGLSGHDLEDEDRKERRRRSSPAELQPRERMGFKHPVLDLPGGF